MPLFRACNYFFHMLDFYNMTLVNFETKAELSQVQACNKTKS